MTSLARFLTFAALPVVLALPAGAAGATRGAAPLGPPALAPAPAAAMQIRVDGAPGAWSPALNVVLLLTVLTVAPAILVSVTSFSRMLISLHFLRQALGTQTAPGNQTLVGLSLFLTYFVMAPIGTQVNREALQPMMRGEIDGPAAIERAWPPLKDFMLRNTRTDEIALFQEMRPAPAADAPAPVEGEVDAQVLIPAFMISEVKTAFQIGILLYLPFLMIELIVSSVLLALGMIQLPPVVVSTPLKLVLFVVVDGWGLVIGSLVKSVH